ncbi:hypothetical protein BGX34_000069 [Mortierella sp. NVP85]|nr:hypothetical protein BGX34_000069 [Mortierella sp. NVP85]
MYQSDPAPSSANNDKDERWLREIFAKYGYHIRRLRLSWIILVDVANASGVCTNLWELTIDLRWSENEKLYWARRSKEGGAVLKQEPIASPTQTPHVQSLKALQSKDLFEPPTSATEEELEEGWTFTQHYWGLVLANSNLKQLSLSRKALFQWLVRSKVFFFKIISEMKRLRDVSAYDYLALADIWGLHLIAPTVETTTVANGYQLFRPPGSVTIEGKNGPLRQNPAIKTLRFGCHHLPCNGTPLNFNPSLPELCTIMLLLPNLTDLVLTGIKDTDPISASLIVPGGTRGLGIRTLQIAETRNLPSLLRFLPNLKVLRFSNLNNDGFNALAIHCRSLEVLEWKRDPSRVDSRVQRKPRQDGLHRFLASCPTLRVFDGIGDFVKANDMIRKPWECLGIEKLRCRIVKIERLTQDEKAVYDNMMDKFLRIQDDMDEMAWELTGMEQTVMLKLKRSREQQEKVYDCLARLTRLKYLDLGFDNRYPFSFESRHRTRSNDEDIAPALDTLELSLESGLDRLGALGNLEVFGFEAIDHRIEEKELEWMTKNWPKLKLLYGLGEDSLLMIEPEERKTQLRKYMEMLRPDVKHGSYVRG